VGTEYMKHRFRIRAGILRTLELRDCCAVLVGRWLFLDVPSASPGRAKSLLGRAKSQLRSCQVSTPVVPSNGSQSTLTARSTSRDAFTPSVDFHPNNNRKPRAIASFLNTKAGTNLTTKPRCSLLHLFTSFLHTHGNP
jgi:hypothetical protein